MIKPKKLFLNFILIVFITISLVTGCAPVDTKETQLEIETKKILDSGIQSRSFELNSIELPFLKGYTEEINALSILSHSRAIDYIYLIDEERLLFIYERNTIITATLFNWKTEEWQTFEFSQPISAGMYMVIQINPNTYGYSVNIPEGSVELYILTVDDVLNESGPYVLPIDGLAFYQFSLSPKLDVTAFVDTKENSIRLNNWEQGLSKELKQYTPHELGLSNEAEIRQVNFLSDTVLFFNWRDRVDIEIIGYGTINLGTDKKEISKPLLGSNYHYRHGFDYSILEYYGGNGRVNIMVTDSEAFDIGIDNLISDLHVTKSWVLEPLRGNLRTEPMAPNIPESHKEMMPATFNMLLHDFEKKDNPPTLLILPRESITWLGNTSIIDDRNYFNGVLDLANERIFSLGAEEMYDDKILLYVFDLK
jgi:hypothetical protein